MTSSNRELFRDYKVQHELQAKMANQPYAVRLRLKSIYNCKRSVIPTAGHVDVVVRKRGNLVKAGFVNLYNCKSVWACPTCAAYELYCHRDKISALINYYSARKIWACMITFTVPHSRNDTLVEVMQRLKTCMDRTEPGRYLKGRIGSIKSTEVTYNDNTGWHPHYHILYFIHAEHWYRLKDEVAHIRRKWESELAEQGYDNFINRANKTSASVYLSLNRKGSPRKITKGDYIAKEMAKLKRGAQSLKSRTPWDLAAAPEPWAFERYIEYALATQGLHRVHYSRSLRCKEVIAKQRLEAPTEYFFGQPQETEVLCSFTKSDWNEIIRDEFATGTRHRRRLLICACISFGRVVEYCLAHDLPTPQPPVRQLVGAVRVVG